ncbi:MAG: hypothetical protein N3G20_12505, partial [Verrucomicrobiae bacterium]|nr:hypothetical protein [Verrucomicrobiae bacterium]
CKWCALKVKGVRGARNFGSGILPTGYAIPAIDWWVFFFGRAVVFECAGPGVVVKDWQGKEERAPAVFLIDPEEVG